MAKRGVNQEGVLFPLTKCVPVGVVFFAMLFWGGCTYENFAGFGSETTNGEVTGIIVDGNGNPASRTQVRLIPAGFNPAVDSAGSIRFSDTTDASGRYSIVVKDTGIFNLQIINLDTGFLTLHKEVSVHHDTIDLKQDTVKPTGTIRIVLPDSVDTMSGYLYVQGTSFMKMIASSHHYTYLGKMFMVFDSLPSVDIYGFNYGRLHSPLDPIRLTDGFTVKPADTVTVTALYYWNVFTSGNSGLPDDALTALLIDASGTKWIGTGKSGLITYSGAASWTTYTTANSSLISNSITALCQDKEGSIWIGTAGGLVKYNNGVWQSFTTQNSTVPDNRITALVSDAQNVKWIGTPRGCAVYNGSAWTVYDTATSKLPENYITGLALGKNDKKLITTRLGLAVYDNGKWSIYYKSDSSAITDTITGVSGSGINTVWIATVKGILGFDMDYNFWFGIDIFNNKRIAMIGMSKEGTIWSGTTNGGTIASLNRINGKSLVLMYTDLNAHVLRGCSGVTCMAADANKTVYFGTENRGLIQVRFPKL